MKQQKTNKNTSAKILKIQKAFRSGQQDAANKAEELYNKFCSSNTCTDCANCCKTLGPRITKTDIKTLSKYLNLSEAALYDKFLNTDEDGDIVFKVMPCPFLGNNNLCSVYEARPRACREYPHIDGSDFYRHLSLHEKNYRYCPAVRFVIDHML